MTTPEPEMDSGDLRIGEGREDFGIPTTIGVGLSGRLGD